MYNICKSQRKLLIFFIDSNTEESTSPRSRKTRNHTTLDPTPHEDIPTKYRIPDTVLQDLAVSAIESLLDFNGNNTGNIIQQPYFSRFRKLTRVFKVFIKKHFSV